MKVERVITDAPQLCFCVLVSHRQSFKGSAAHYHHSFLHQRLCLRYSRLLSHQSLSHYHTNMRTHTLPRTHASLAAFCYLPKTKPGRSESLLVLFIFFVERLRANCYVFHSAFRRRATFIWSSFMKSAFIKGGLSVLLRDADSLVLPNIWFLLLTLAWATRGKQDQQ